MALSDLRLSKNMKYTALYFAMRFFEDKPNVFIKRYKNGTEIKILADTQVVYINEKEAFLLNTHESFVKLECINRLLELGYGINDFTIEPFVFNGYSVSFIVWDDKFNIGEIKNREILYKSRLVSGVIEYESKIKAKDEVFDYGIFEEKAQKLTLSKKIVSAYSDEDFIFDENRVMKYNGKEKIVKVPDGITELESSCFWDNQFIEEVILPESLINLGGDTFYNCKNLKSIVIPKNVRIMGNNPFAGCPDITVYNESPCFILENGVLYTADKKTLIYCSIKGTDNEFIVPEGVTVITKHAFYLCDRLKKITLPATLRKMENNPFSGCSKLEIENHSTAYIIKDDVIYNGFMTSIIGTLNKIETERLEIPEGIKTINRNSFWNCKGIKTIVFPESLEDIGYNPFVGCCNIHFESKSKNFVVKDGVLYNKDKSKIICYPSWKAVGIVDVPESVITLERGAFSGCDKMTGINLKNVNIINKSCFTNCSNLQEIYCSDFITYIGEWAFAYCTSLKKISVSKNTIIDNNAFSNCNPQIEMRESFGNYVIESDNIYTLKSMQKAYKGKIDSILIDPPYNSHIDYIGYKDADYHEGYKNFLKDRFSLAYSLLSDKGFMVVNIDEGEVVTIETLCKEIFGNSNVSVKRWKKKHPFFDTNRIVLNPNKVQTDYEYIIFAWKKNAKLNKIMQPYIENGKLKEKIAEVPETFDCFGTTSSAKDEIAEIFGERTFFSTPKPVKLIKEFARATTNKNSIVLDFFAGSGTTGQAVVELNQEDDGNRKFILVTNSESNICEKVTIPRIEKTGVDYERL